MARTTIKNQQSAIGNQQFVRLRSGSAIILAIVLTSLLAIIGVLFLISSRVDSIATSSIADNKDLTLAVDTVIAKISQDLVLDVSKGSIDPNCYADYPDPCNFWLASLEPYYVALRNYHWRQVSDIYGFSYSNPVFQDTRANTLFDYNDNFKIFTAADADGDGIGDSIWVPVSGKTSSKGKPIFAAVRIIDNGGMLNVNTGFKFDPSSSVGASQLDINLMALSWRPYSSPYNPADDNPLLSARSPVNPTNYSGYEQDVIWQYGNPNSNYTPFDISDELEMRYRFLLNQESIDTRLEAWGGQFRNSWVNSMPFQNIVEWYNTSCIDANSLPPDANYAYRHIATTYNMDRIIAPDGNKMFNINLDDVNLDVNDRDFSETNSRKAAWDLFQLIRTTVYAALPDNHPLVRAFAQFAVNVADMRDGDIDVTVLNIEPNNPPDANNTFYGFDAQPFICEVGMFSSGDPCVLDRTTVKFYNPFDRPIDLNDFVLELRERDTGTLYAEFGFPSGTFIGQRGSSAPPDTYILSNTDPNRQYLQLCGVWYNPDKTKPVLDPRLLPDKSKPPVWTAVPGENWLYLKRRVALPEGWIYVDRQPVDCAAGYYSRLPGIGGLHPWHIVYQTLRPGRFGTIDPNQFSNHNFSFFLPNPFDPCFVTVGDIPRVLTLGNNTTINSTIGQQLLEVPPSAESTVRINLCDPCNSNLFQYLTVIDPFEHGYTDPNNPETRIKGRININTAPWFVIAQLPWVTDPALSLDDRYKLAQAIVAYRDKLAITGGPDYYQGGVSGSRQLGMGVTYPVREEPGFASIGELMNVTNGLSGGGYDSRYDIRKYATDACDLTTLPDLTPADSIVYDFEERDVIFSRISNLVTVRSDVFTAYILVRIGTNGPQKRVVAILDRSGVYPNPAGGYTGKVKIIAIQPVPDPR